MVVTCEQVWQEISNYLESDLDPSLRTALDEHFHVCPRCASLLAGTRNVVQLYGDERLFQLPLGFSGRLHKKLARQMPVKRRTIYGWGVAAAAVALLAGGIALSRPKPSIPIEVRSPLARPGKHVPAKLTVLVAGESKIFHVAGCDLLRAKDGKIRSMSAEQAEHEGYVPCIRCLGKYLSSVTSDFLKRHFRAGALA
jgi:Putative zinc-finger